MEDSDGTCGFESLENESKSEFAQENFTYLNGNPHLADALNKVLRISKKQERKKSIVLSKAKLYQPNKRIKNETCGFEIEPNLDNETPIVKDEEDIKPDIKPDRKKLVTAGLAKHERLKRGRVIPSILDKEKERKLSRIATRGVVHLFNAVRHHQSKIDDQLKDGKLTETKKEKVLKTINRKAFLEALNTSSTNRTNIVVRNSLDDTEIKKDFNVDEDAKDLKQPSWAVLRSNFMIGAKLKDWDKKADEKLSVIDNDESN